MTSSFFVIQGLTNLRSVTWTKVSLKEAKIRATPKTSSPAKKAGRCQFHDTSEYNSHQKR